MATAYAMETCCTHNRYFVLRHPLNPQLPVRALTRSLMRLRKITLASLQ